MPKHLLYLEGWAVFALATAAYFHLGGGWLLFAALFPAPDLFLAGYLAGPDAGSILYNLAHTYVFPVGMLVWGAASGYEMIVLIALIWFAHIGLDRGIGYGLKYATAFKDTHLGRV